MFSRVLTLFAFIALGSLAANGDTPHGQRALKLTLANGDVIHGTLVHQDANSVTVQHPVLGEITVPREALADPVPAILAPEEATPAVTPPQEDPPATTGKSVLGLFEVPENWRGRFSVGTSWESGRVRKNSVDLRGELGHTEGRNDFLYSAFYRFEETNSDVSTDRWGASFRYRRDVAKHQFIQTVTSYEVDRIKNIDHKFTQTLGYGFRVVDTPDFTLNVIPGVAYEYQKERSKPSDSDFLFNLNQDLSWKINERFTFIQTSDFFLNPSDTSEYRINVKAGIRGAITDSLSLDLNYQYDYDRTVAGNGNRYESKLTSAVVLNF